MLARIIFVACGLFNAQAFGLLIDDFSDGDIVVQVDVSNPVRTTIQTGLDTDVVIGGLRLLSLLLDTPQTGDLGRATVDTTTDTLRIETNEGFEKYGVSWATTDTTTALNTDLLADGSDAFRIDVAAVSTVSASDVTIRLILRSGLDEGVTQRNTSVVRLPPSVFPYAVRVPFSRFPDVDFTDIDFIGFDDSTGPFSLTLDAIRTVPEPAGIGMLFIGLVFGLVPLARGRKRIKGAAAPRLVWHVAPRREEPRSWSALTTDRRRTCSRRRPQWPPSG